MSPFPTAVASGAGADEDAVTVPPEVSVTDIGQPLDLDVPMSGASKSGTMGDWIDFNRNGAFDNTTERACAPFGGGATSVDLTWTVPAGTSATSTRPSAGRPRPTCAGRSYSTRRAHR